MGVKFAQEKYKMDIRSSPKALFRLRTQCEKMKKVLSANPESVLSVEAVMNDIDLRMNVKRDDLMANSSHLLERMDAVFEKALKDSGISDVDILPIVSRLPRFDN
jgi:heat shock protein 4